MAPTFHHCCSTTLECRLLGLLFRAKTMLKRALTLRLLPRPRTAASQVCAGASLPYRNGVQLARAGHRQGFPTCFPPIVRQLTTESGHGEEQKKRRSYDEFTEESERRREEDDERRRRADEEEEVADAILDGGLRHVAELGWTSEALKAGAADAGFPSVSAGMAAAAGPAGSDPGAALALRHLKVCDRRLKEWMATRVAELKEGGERLRVRKFIREAVEERMNGALVRCGRWAEAMSLLSRPDNFPSYLECELRLMDSIWHAAGDTSADLNWYTKRVSLATIYKTTELCMLEDRSEDFSETWAFLDRRFEDEVAIADFLAGSAGARNVIRGVATTLQNVLGVPGRR